MTEISEKEQLIMYRGQLKYLREKYVMRLNLIKNYISRIETETAITKDENTYLQEKEQNKDLIIEVGTFLKDLGE